MGGRLGQSPFDALSGETFEYPIALIRSAPIRGRAAPAAQTDVLQIPISTLAVAASRWPNLC